MRTWPIIACMLLGLAGSAVAAEPVLVDEVVAVVNKHVITLSEVRQEAALILVERRGQAGLEQRITRPFMGQVLEFLINQRVLLDEARRVKLPPVTDAEIETLMGGFRARFANRESFARFLFEHSMSEDAIAEVLVRHLRVERLKESKLRSIPEADEATVRRYFERNRNKFGGAEFETVSAAIRHRIDGKRRDKELARWVWELRRRAEVKVLVDLEEAAEGRP